MKKRLALVKNFHFKHSFSKILPSDVSNTEFGVLFSQKFYFFSKYHFNFSIVTSEDFFLDAVFRPKDNKILAISKESKKIDLFDVKKGFLLKKFIKNTTSCDVISFMKNGTNLLMATEKGVIKTWDVLSDQLVGSVKFTSSRLKSILCWPQNYHVYAFSSYDGLIRLIDCRVKCSVVSSFNHGYSVESFDFFKNGVKIAGVGANFLKVWDLRSKKAEFIFQENFPISRINCNQEDKIVYSQNFNIKEFNPKKYKTESLLKFKKNIRSFSFTVFNIIIGFYDEALLFKNFFNCKKVFLKNHVKKTASQPNQKRGFFFIKSKNYTYSLYQKKKRQQFDSIDILYKKTQFVELFALLRKNKNTSAALLLAIEIVMKKKFKTRLLHIEIVFFFFFMNTGLLSNLFIVELVRLSIDVCDSFFPVVIFFYSYFKMFKYLKLLNTLLKKFLGSHYLNSFLEKKNLSHTNIC
nr:U3 small nucleolar ribonucleoprotein [Cryptomonas paramecium]